MDTLRKTRIALAVLSVLFAVRVAAEATARLAETAALPPLAVFQSEAIPYAALLILQSALLGGMALTLWRLGRIGPKPRAARALVAAALLYAAATVGRAIVGVFGLASGSWVDAPIATAFHLVLAAWLFIFGYWIADAALRSRLRQATRRVGRFAAYPLLLGGALALFFWLRAHDAPSGFSSYLAGFLAASGVLILELAAPYRAGWTPSRRTVLQDALYLSVVQVALPAALTLGVASVAADALDGGLGLWPTHLPIWAQAVILLVAADFLRYWLHRAAHYSIPLWRFHAVHHAPEELYLLNVGRFHPIEKSVQFLLDTAPFILLGVAPEVVALYFVFYATNGFFQHSNVDVRLGPLNWIIAGPELHRWHHSKVIEESNHNFGNNLILWDALFGTRYLPSREVGPLGLENPAYPKDFLSQIVAPVTVDPNGGPKT